jgi:cell volume regulation protein A
VNEVQDFGTIVLIVAAGFALAIATSRLSERFSIPGPAIFLLAAAGLSAIVPSVGHQLSIREVERIGVVALIVILFDGGARIGLRRLRVAAVPTASLGIVGTFATAGLVTIAAHVLLGFSWTIAGLLGAAISPTDPAVMFSVLGRREVAGRTGTILEAESGLNDPVGIALMIGMIDLAIHADASFWTVVREFALEMSIGLAVGAAGAYALLLLMEHVRLPTAGLYPIRTLAAAGVIYGAASSLHGSGFLAVFVAGIVVGDARFPYQQDVERFMTSLASIAEIAVFVALGLTIHLRGIPGHTWVDGLVLAGVVALVARPLVVAALLAPARLNRGERLFVMWGGLKGAVPIFLAAFAILAGVHRANEIYGIVFVVVALSVLIQGSSIPRAAALLKVPMRVIRERPEHT